jgi:hypothetical protein
MKTKAAKSGSQPLPKKPSKKPARGAKALRALSGKGRRAKVIDFSGPAPAAVRAIAETYLPKPRTTRYPIPMADFERHKQAAKTKKALDRRELRVVRDKRGARKELASAPAGAGVAAALPSAPGPAGGLTLLTNFSGIPATGWLPPDCTMSAGPEHVMVSANSSLAVYPKAGGAPLLQQTLSAWFANVTQGTTIFDPKLLYDQQAARWVVLAVALSATNESLFLISASATSSPLGAWRNYALDAAKDGNTPTNNWADYPGLGVDADALYLTANMFLVDGDFQYSKIRIVPKAAVYSGGVANYFDFVGMTNADGTPAFTVQPCHTFGAPQSEYLVSSSFPSGNELSLWTITSPITAPALTRRSVTVSAYDMPPDADQKGGATPLDAGDVRMLHAVFRGGSVWTAMTTRQNWPSGNAAAVHWFQIDPSVGTLVQEGIFGADGRHCFYPALVPDTNGNVVMVFCASSSTEYASIYFTGRAPNDPLGQMGSSLLLKAGVAGYVGLDSSGRNRWGDYNGVAADPAEAGTLWFYSMFVVAANQWGTWVGSAKL